MEGKFMLGNVMVIHRDAVITVKGMVDWRHIKGQKCTIHVGNESIPLYPQAIHIEGNFNKLIFEDPNHRKCIANNEKFTILLDPDFEESELKYETENTTSFVTNSMINLLQRCNICLQNFKVGERCEWLPCSHVFHAHCSNQWENQSSLCPLCKTNRLRG